MVALDASVTAVPPAATRPSELVERVTASKVAGGGQAVSRRALRIGALLPLAVELTAPILAAYHEIHPQVRIEMIDVAGHGGDQALLDGRVDAAFLWTPVRWERLRIAGLFTDGLVALLGSGHPLAHSKVLRTDALADENFTMSASMSDLWRHASALPAWRNHPERGVWIDNPRSALEAIASGRAVSIGPASLARTRSAPGVTCVPLLVPHGPRAVVATRHDESRPHVLTLLDVSAEVATKLQHLVPTATGSRSAERGNPPWGAPR